MPLNKIKLNIAGSSYTINSMDPEEHVLQIARTLDQDIKEVLEKVEALKAASYGEIREWFLATFEEIKKFHEDHDKEVEKILKSKKKKTILLDGFLFLCLHPDFEPSYLIQKFKIIWPY